MGDWHSFVLLDGEGAYIQGHVSFVSLQVLSFCEEFETCLSLCSCLLGFSGTSVCRQWLKDKVRVFPTSQNSAAKLSRDRDTFENSTRSPGTFLSSLESST